MEIQNNNPSWSKQIDIVNRERFSLSYMIPKKEKVGTVEQKIDNSPKTEI